MEMLMKNVGVVVVSLVVGAAIGWLGVPIWLILVIFVVGFTALDVVEKKRREAALAVLAELASKEAAEKTAAEEKKA